MSGVVTVPYLRRRILVSKLVLLVTLAASAAVAVFTLKAQEERSEYGIALQQLGHSIIRLEQELDQLAFDSRRGVASRDAARTAVASADAQFGSIVLSSRGKTAPEEWSAQFRRGGGPPEGVSFHLAAGPMPDSLARIWVPGSAARIAGPSAHLEYVLDRLLLLSGQLVRGTGPLSPREADRVQTIKSSIAALVTPRLEEITAVLDDDLHASVDRALVSLLALLAVAAIVAMLNGLVIFRPLERAVMAAQARLEVERDRAIEAAAAKRNFLSVVSHELRTPMNGVLGFAGLLLASDLAPEQRRQVEIIRSSGKTLLALVNDLLDLSRMEAGGLELADEPFSLEELIGEVLGLARAGVTGREIEVAVYIDPRLPDRLRGDPERVRQILTNLVGNAVKFTGRGTVTLEARRLESDGAQGPTLELVVTDTGPGIPPDQQTRIFERFTQVEGAGQPTGGTGLGLAICRELSERMGGDIEVESAPGEGAAFRVRLRLDAAAERIGTRAPALAADPLAGKRVLIIDDNAIVARLIARQLEDWGLAAETAAGAEAAWRLLKAAGASGSPYSLVLIDGSLPDGEPHALARWAREDPESARPRLVLVDGAAGESGAQAFDAVEVPPLMPRRLLAALARLSGESAGGGGPVREAEADRAGPRILFAEDDVVSRQLVVQLLESAGYRVDAVGDGASAVRVAARGEHDLVLMDIRMPAMDGVEATRRIRASEGAPGRVPILALTANNAAEDMVDYRAAGMNDVIPKPVEAGRLLAAVGRALRAGAAPPHSPSATHGGSDGATTGSEARMASTR